MHVLYVDPDAEARSRVRDALRDADLAVTAVSSAGTALETVRTAPVACLVCEHDLPEGAAPSLIERARRVDPELPAVVYTGAGSEALAGEALAAGADGYVPKAEGVEVLLERLADLDSGRSAAPAERPSLLFEQAPLGIVEWDPDCRVVGWNPAAAELFGYDAGEALGRTARELVVPEGARGRVEMGWEQLLETDGDHHEAGAHSVTRNVRADGTEITCEWHHAPLVDGGEAVGVVSFVREVTDERRRADQLEALQETSRALMRADSREAIAEEVVDAAEAVLDQPLASVRLYDPEAEVLEPVAFTDRAEALAVDAVDDLPAIGPGEAPVWQVFESGEPEVFDRIDPAGSVYGEDAYLESAAVYPLGEHGVLAFGATEAAAFDETATNVARVLATTAKTALDGAARARELERHETILEAVGDGVYALDPEGRYTHVNEEFVSITGYDREELLGSHVSMLTDEADVERGRELVRELLAGEADVRTYEVTVETADGERLPCEVRMTLLPGEAFAGTVGTLRPVAERKRIQRELRSERDRLAALFDNVPDPVVCSRVTGEGPVVQRVNPAFERVFGYDAEAVVGEPLDEYVVPSGAREEALELNERAVDGEVVEAEVRRRTARGLREFELTVVPVDIGEADPTTYGIYADVTDQKQRRKRVQVLNRVLRHDLRNGMNVVRGAAEILRERLADDPAGEHAETILDSVDELLALAERTRTVERALDRPERPTEPLDLVAVVEGIVDALTAAHPEADVELSRPDRAVVAGDDLLELAIHDVIENAIVHNDRARPRVSIEVATGEREGVVVVRVADDGPGIPREERRLLTEEQEITQLRHASGLGLWLVNWAVTHAGGDLAFEDNDPRGSVVAIRLPRASDLEPELSVGGT